MTVNPILDDQSLRTRRRTKIVATLGPASSDPEIIRTLIERGMNCARINGSHGTHEEHAAVIRAVRKLAIEVGRPVAILYDLQGPKIRTTRDSSCLPRRVRTGEEVTFVVRRAPVGDEIGVDYDHLDKDLSVGQPLLIDDGELATRVVEVGDQWVRCQVENDGVIGIRKGINLPQSAVSTPALTDKDRRDARFAVEQEVDAIALSFVRRAADVEELKELIGTLGAKTPVIAKIEKPQALEELAEIIEASWGVMVARGDLGVELSPEEVPSVQKRIIREANERCRPVITATQMLDSMTRNPRPTRAEASDVANAVLDGTDAVMLSGETAAGKYPVESVEMMVRIIRTTEFYDRPKPFRRRHENRERTTPEAVADAAVSVARHIRAHAIVAFTRSGTSALLASQRRPRRPILVFTHDQRLCNLLAMTWGVRSYLIDPMQSTDELLVRLDEELLRDDLAKKGDNLVLIMGAPTHRLGPPNFMLVHRVGEWSSLE